PSATEGRARKRDKRETWHASFDSSPPGVALAPSTAEHAGAARGPSHRAAVAVAPAGHHDHRADPRTRDDAFAIVGGMQPAFEDDLHTVVDGRPSPDGVARRVSRGCAGQVLLEKGGDALEEILVEKARLASAARAPGAAPGNDDLGGDDTRLDQQAVVVQA